MDSENQTFKRYIDFKDTFKQVVSASQVEVKSHPKVVPLLVITKRFLKSFCQSLCSPQAHLCKPPFVTCFAFRPRKSSFNCLFIIFFLSHARADFFPSFSKVPSCYLSKVYDLSNQKAKRATFFGLKRRRKK